MKIYTKQVIKTNDGIPTGSVVWFLHDISTGHTLLIKNYDFFHPLIPYVIDGTSMNNALEPGNIIIDELEFHEIYDKAIDSLQNFVP